MRLSVLSVESSRLPLSCSLAACGEALDPHEAHDSTRLLLRAAELRERRGEFGRSNIYKLEHGRTRSCFFHKKLYDLFGGRARSGRADSAQLGQRFEARITPRTTIATPTMSSGLTDS